METESGISIKYETLKISYIIKLGFVKAVPPHNFPVYNAHIKFSA